MKLPLSWLKDYVDIDLPLDQLASTLTMAGLEVEEVRLVGLPMPKSDGPQEFKFTGLEWARDKFVVAQVDEVMPHPNADRRRRSMRPDPNPQFRAAPDPGESGTIDRLR